MTEHTYLSTVSEPTFLLIPGDSEPTIIVSDSSPGKSAYEVALTEGFVGTREEWLASLVSVVPGPAPQLQVADGQVQWRPEGAPTWTDLIAVEALVGPQGPPVELRADGPAVQWRVEGDPDWTPLTTLPVNELSVGVVAVGPVDAQITGEAPAQLLHLSIPGVNIQVAGGRIEWCLDGDAEWTPLIDLIELVGPQGDPVQIRAAGGWIEWRYEGELGWTPLVQLESLRGPQGPPVELSVGSVTTVAPGEDAGVRVEGGDTLHFDIPRGQTGPANELSIGTVDEGPAAATITGSAPEQTLNLTLPPGPVNELSVGTVTTVAAGEAASATITGSAPDQTLNLSLPRGADSEVPGPAPQLQVTATHIQWKHEDASTWTDLAALEDLTGADGPPPQLQVTTDHIQWRGGDDDPWNDLVALADLTGADGPPPQLRVEAGWVQWRVPDGAWTNLVALEDLTGPPNELSIGTVTDGETADATITGSAPSQTLNLTLPVSTVPGPAGIEVVTHGTDPSVPRPEGVPVVYWVGTAQPMYALPTDLWYEG